MPHICICDLDAYEDALNYVEQHPEAEEDEEEIEMHRDGRGVYWLDKGHKRFIRTQLGEHTAFRARDAGPQERELERLLQVILKGTRYEGKVFAVGGYVRDEILGREPADLDVVVEMPYGAQRVAGYLQELFPGVVVEPLSLDYPIWHVSFPGPLEHAGETYAVAGAEMDLTDTQKVQPDYTEFGPISEDVKRRDFTVNMLLKDLSSGEILDPTGLGREDISKGVLHAIPDADKILAFRDQPRQMLRLIRFMVQYGWHPDEEEEAALRESVRYLATISGHGLKKEFHKLKERGLLSAALKLMREYGMLSPLREAWQKAKQDAKV